MDVKKGKRSLRAYKGHLTRETSNSETLLGQTKLDVVELENAVTSLETRWYNYDQAYEVVEKLLLETADTEDEVEDFQTDYYQLKKCYQQQITKLRTTISMSKVSGTSGASSSGVSQGFIGPSLPKLPSILLPTFSGELIEYEAFIDQFEAQIGSRPDLEPVTKLQYLKTQLKGHALDLIKGYSSTSDNYQSAMDVLKETYGDGEKVKHCLLQTIINLDQPKHNRGDLETFRIKMLNLTRSLKNKCDYSCCEWIIASLFQHKLPTSTIRQLYLKYEANYFDLSQLNEGLRDLISHMEVESHLKSSKTVKQNMQNITVDRSKEQAIGTYFTTDTKIKRSKTNNDRSCKFCEGSHNDSQCTRYSKGCERIERLKELKLCLRCMGKHYTKSCTAKIQICRRCRKGNHHTTLCKTYDNTSSDTGSNQNSGTPNLEDQPSSNSSQPTNNVGHVNVTTGAATTKPSGVALATAMAVLEQSGENLRLFFDTGSQRSFITRDIVERAGISIKSTVQMTLAGFMGQPTTQDFQIVKPVIRMGNRRKRITAVVVDELPKAIVTAGLTDVIKHLNNKGLKLADREVKNDRVGPIDILIGSDHYYDFISKDVQMVDGIHLLNSPAGYLITGKIPSGYSSSLTNPTSSQNVVPESVIVMKITENFDPLHTDLQVEHPPIHKLWDLDIIGIDPTQAAPDDRISYQEYLDTVRYDDGQYWVKLPWKINKPQLPNNYHRSLGQMYSLVKELTKKNQIEKYQAVLKEQLESKFIEKVPDAHPKEQSHYLPHHAVVKESATTPLRIVYNCSSRANPGSPSLNDCLMTGPTLTRKLGDMLLTFRTGEYAYTADISKAFLRVGLSEEDRDFTRFLWPSDPYDLNSSMDTYRFRSVLFGATSSPFLLQATIDYHLRKSRSPVKEILASSFYVDNFQGTITDEEMLFNIYKEANREMKMANMPLRQWNTNNPKLRKIILNDYPEYNIPTVTSVLGMQWNTVDDSLTLQLAKYSQSEQNHLTKRQLLAKISMLFDPLGLFSPITIKGKLLLQKSWKMKIDWDDSLPDCYMDSWRELQAEYQQLTVMKVPRVTADEKQSCRLHIFCDASAKAYGAAAYITTDSHSHLLTSKARVAPVKGNRTIPQMELTALLVATNLARYICKILNHLIIAETYIWSDSEAALLWVRNDNSKLPYVKNRVAEIREIKGDIKLMHVDTESNPADLLSRGVTLKQLRKHTLWFQGPDWIMDKGQWPEQKSYMLTCIGSTEIQTCVGSTETKLAELADHSSQLIDPMRYSSLGKLLRVTKYVFGFLHSIIERKGWTTKLQRMPTCPTTFWVKQVQSQTYRNEIRILQELSGNDPKTQAELSKKTLRNDKLIRQLGLFLDDDLLIRCRGRIQNSSLGYGAKHPVLLPKKHWFTQLVIRNCHYNTLHGGVNETLINVRKGFWIPKARQDIKSYIRNCTICRRYDARPIKYPGPPPLPSERMQESRPFQVVGVDYTGSIQLQNPGGEQGDKPTKVYICLFTCARTRAVHLELVDGMSANTFLQAFRRFISRRSCPRLVISDNGSNFKAAEVFLGKYFELPEVQDFFDSRRCEWRFIPPRAPWQGGFYERMVGVVKKCLRKVLHNKRVNIEELRTLLMEIEARVNNRPLTYVHEDINEPEPLTPNHLLQGFQIETIPPVINREYVKDPDFLLKLGKPTSEELTNRFIYINKLLRLWNNAWRQDYLTSLREYFYGANNPTITCSLKPGDIVLIDCDSPRATWPLGKIVSLLPDKTGVIRVVKVLTKGCISLRTIDKLIPLEISEKDPNEYQLATNAKDGKPRRQAAIEACRRLRDQLDK